MRSSTAIAAMLALNVAFLEPTRSAQSCETPRRTAPGRETAGVETHALSHAGRAFEVRLWRFKPEEWSVRVVDMRDQRHRLAEGGSFAAPSYSLNELAQTQGNKSVVSSGGMTESLVAPQPVGLLKVAGKQKSGIYAGSRLLDGVLCIDRVGKLSLLSEATAAGRRVVQDKRVWDACHDAVQAGPMLVDGAAALITTRLELTTARVFAGLDTKGRQVLGFVPSVSTFDLACALASPELGVRQAIALQGDALGGIDFGMHSGVKADTWGQDHAAIPSALVVTRKRP